MGATLQNGLHDIQLGENAIELKCQALRSWFTHVCCYAK